MRHFSTCVSSIVESTTCSSPVGLGSRRPLDTGMELPSNHVTTRLGTSTRRALRGMHGIVPERPLNIYSETISASHSMNDRRVLGRFAVASLGWVTPVAATEGVTPLFFPEKPGDFFAHRCHYHYRFLLLSLGCHPPPGCHPTPFFTCPTSFLHYSL